jgi:MYXO-CTERM domain-containing protein
MAAHPLIRGLHDIGLAAWAGGSLMGAVGLTAAAASLDDPRQRASASTAGWRRWAPVNAVAVGAHVVGATGLLVTDRNRVRHQKGVGKSTAIKTVATGAGLGVAAWSAALNQKMASAAPVPVEGATEPGASTPEDVARTQRQLKVAQWLNPLVAGSLVALASWQSEQQRTREVTRGVLQRLPSGMPTPSPKLALGAGALALLVASRRRRKASGLEEGEAVAVVEVAEVDLVATGTPPVTAGDLR